MYMVVSCVIYTSTVDVWTTYVLSEKGQSDVSNRNKFLKPHTVKHIEF